MSYVEELVRGLKDENPEVRVRVANALKELEDPRATIPLVEALGDPCEDVRRAVAWALSWVGDERARPSLIRALEDECDGVRLWGASGLERIGNECAVEALIESLTDPDEAVRLRAVYALARIGDGRAVEPLIKAIDDDDTQVRMAVKFYLREAFGVPVPSDFEEAKKQMREHSLEQRRLNEKLETVLNVIIQMKQATGAVRDEELYQRLGLEHEIGEDEALGLLVQLMEKGLIDFHKNGTRISV